MKIIKEFFNNIISINPFWGIEIILLIGVFLIVFTNFLLNLYFGLYTVGFLLIAYSIFSYRKR